MVICAITIVVQNGDGCGGNVFTHMYHTAAERFTRLEGIVVDIGMEDDLSVNIIFLHVEL